jgi:hypothetical protein
LHHIVNTRKKSSRVRVAVIWVVGVATITSGCVIKLFRCE